tara:strand:- start:613 stop:1017 length:405 start_codon:yes stop_codon:yes gene_type:complete
MGVISWLRGKKAEASEDSFTEDGFIKHVMEPFVAIVYEQVTKTAKGKVNVAGISSITVDRKDYIKFGYDISRASEGEMSLDITFTDDSINLSSVIRALVEGDFKQLAKSQDFKGLAQVTHYLGKDQRGKYKVRI